MTNGAIYAEGLSKEYVIGKKQKGYMTFRETLTDVCIAPFQRVKQYFGSGPQGSSVSEERIWALRDVSFEIRQGDVVGIIGRNGAGKSTLLKILSRITEPTKGFAEMHGRVGSLLEVGTGFHPELTGRENIYLNGAIIGMKRAEIDRKFDEIVAFAEVEKFIDTPVKRYSSGMYLRLAFAVAAHLETEILLVDEVLAVGDVSFQKKCLGKMSEVARKGRTVLFVSHNMGAIENFCTSGIWIDQGMVVEQGDIHTVVRNYLKSCKEGKPSDMKSGKETNNAKASIRDVTTYESSGYACSSFRMGDTVTVEFDMEFFEAFKSIEVTIEVKRLDTGINVLHLMNHDCGLVLENIEKGMHRFRVELPQCFLYPASYAISIWVGTNGGKTEVAYVADVSEFSMIQSSVTARTTPLSLHREAVFYIPSRWFLLKGGERGSEGVTAHGITQYQVQGQYDKS